MVSDVAARMIRFFNVNEPIFPVVRYDLVCSIGLLPWPGANRDVRALLRQHLRDRTADAFAPAGYESGFSLKLKAHCDLFPSFLDDFRKISYSFRTNLRSFGGVFLSRSLFANVGLA
jgi:hypothetical protein